MYCSLRCSWSIACRCSSNCIFIIDLSRGFSGLGKDNCKTRRETIKFWYLIRLILKLWRYMHPGWDVHQSTNQQDSETNPITWLTIVTSGIKRSTVRWLWIYHVFSYADVQWKLIHIQTLLCLYFTKNKTSYRKISKNSQGREIGCSHYCILRVWVVEKTNNHVSWGKFV